jgi:hypothetical protein
MGHTQLRQFFLRLISVSLHKVLFSHTGPLLTESIKHNVLHIRQCTELSICCAVN